MQRIIWVGWKIALGALLFFGVACSTPVIQQREPQEVKGSSLEISYFLGHSRYRIQMTEDLTGVSANASTDGKVLGDVRVDREKYLEFKSKIFAFMQSSSGNKRSPAEADPDCRNPFTITLSDSVAIESSRTHKLVACRSGDDATIGRLIRDGEFLIYSRNQSFKN